MCANEYPQSSAGCGVGATPREHVRALFVILVLGMSVHGCHSQKASVAPSIEFTKVPEARDGGPEAMTEIAGRVTGAQPGERIVLFAKSGQWWIQPLTADPFTTIRRDSTWGNSTHFGTEYGALLVTPDYRPPAMVSLLPTTGGAVRAVAVVTGRPGPLTNFTTLHFDGYDWKLRYAPSDRGGLNQLYDPANAWIDESGALHFRISMNSGKWHCAEVNLTRSLGYGTYRFVVRDSSLLEPAAVLSMFTWDETSAEQNHREFGVEISRWGEPANRNAQFNVQPYYVPANVSRFVAPSGRVTYSVRWGPESLSFRAVQGAGVGNQHVIAEHSFTAGIPTPGNESVHMNLYIFGSARIPLKQQTEAVVEKFEYIP